MTIAVISGRRYHRHMANLPSPARALTLSAINHHPDGQASDRYRPSRRRGEGRARTQRGQVRRLPADGRGRRRGERRRARARPRGSVVNSDLGRCLWCGLPVRLVRGQVSCAALLCPGSRGYPPAVCPTRSPENHEVPANHGYSPGLENRSPFTRTAGSNPAPSAPHRQDLALNGASRAVAWSWSGRYRGQPGTTRDGRRTSLLFPGLSPGPVVAPCVGRLWPALLPSPSAEPRGSVKRRPAGPSRRRAAKRGA
jgi:hypothetical protein